MIVNSGNGWNLCRSLSVAAVIAGAISVFSTTAIAGECPAGKMGVDVTKPGATANKEATD